jgi:hypothetical protein
MNLLGFSSSVHFAHIACYWKVFFFSLQLCDSKSKSHCDWLTVSKSWCGILAEAYDQLFITVWQLRYFVGRPLWQEDGSVFCICCLPLPAQSFLGPSPLGLATIFYCLRFETSLFHRLLWFAGSRWRYSTPPQLCDSESKSHCDWRSVSQSVSLGVKPNLGPMARYLFLFNSYGPITVGRPLWRELVASLCNFSTDRVENTALSSSGPTVLYYDVMCSLPPRGVHCGVA